MGSRLKLQEELETLLGNRNVYFQPPPSLKMKYPCIVYDRVGIDVKHADDMAYNAITCYEVTIISKDPDFFLFDEFIHHFPMCSAGRPYRADNLNHNPFTLYY